VENARSAIHSCAKSSVKFNPIFHSAKNKQSGSAKKEASEKSGAFLFLERPRMTTSKF
jgi:hypothetical protein